MLRWVCSVGFSCCHREFLQVRQLKHERGLGYVKEDGAEVGGRGRGGAGETKGVR